MRGVVSIEPNRSVALPWSDSRDHLSHLTDGQAYAQLPDESRRDLGAGDVVIFPHGDPHRIGNGAGKPVDSLKTFAKNLSNGLKVARYGGGGELTKFVCGYMTCDPSLSEVVLAGLPPMFVVNIANDSAGQWLANSIRFSVPEAGAPGTGSDVVFAKSSRRCAVSFRTCPIRRRDGSPAHATL